LFNGRTSASQADDVGSIPITRSNLVYANVRMSVMLPRQIASFPVRLMILAIAPIIAACASGPEMTECADGSHVQGSECHLAPDGTYYGDAAEIPEDVADDVADRIDDEADEQSGIVEVEVVEIELGND
jgi:hypothetical protein